MSSTEDNFISHGASSRIAEERKRLKFSQEQAGQTCSVSREIWGKYERGVSTPGGDVLFQFAKAGADVLYILTGQRQAAAPEPVSAQAIEEELLLDAYRELDGPARKKLLKAVLQGGTDQAGGKIINHDGSTIGNQIHGDVTITSQSIGAVAPKTTKKKN